MLQEATILMPYITEDEAIDPYEIVKNYTYLAKSLVPIIRIYASLLYSRN